MRAANTKMNGSSIGDEWPLEFGSLSDGLEGDAGLYLLDIPPSATPAATIDLPADAIAPSVAPTRSEFTIRQSKLLSELQVALTVDIGQLLLSVDDLLEIVPGNTFAFQFDPLQEFSLRLGREEVAKAILIMQPDGSLGLQTVSVNSENICGTDSEPER